MQKILRLVLFLSVFAQTPPVLAQSPISFGGHLTDVILLDTTAIVAEGENLLWIPLTPPYQPTDRLSLGEKILALKGHPQGIYALTETGVFAIHPQNKTLLNFAPGGGQNLSITGKWLAVAAEDGGGRLREILPDGRLRGAWQIDTPGRDWDAAITEDDILAVADGGAGIRLYDMTDPNQPQTLSALTEIAPASKIIASGTMLYATDSRNHLHVINAATPENPIIEGRYAPIRDAQKTIIIENWLVVADAADGLKVYDARTLRYRNGELDLPTLDVQRVNNWLIAARQDGLHIYDAARLPQFVEIAVVPLWETPTALAPQDNRIVAALGSQGLVAVSLTNFQVMAALSVRGTITDLEIQNNFAYVILDDGRFLILDITNFNTPQLASITELSGTPQTINLNGTSAVIACGAAGFYLFDVASPAAPQKLSLLPAEVFAWDGYPNAEGSLVVLDGTHLRTINATTFAEIARFPAVGKSLVAGNDLLVTLGENQLANFSVFGGNPTPLATYISPLEITALQAQENELLISSRTPEAALIRLDVSNPSQPTEIAVYAIDGGVEKFALREGDLLTLSDGFTHWQVTPYALSAMGSYQPPSEFSGFYPHENTLYLLGETAHQWDGENLIPLDFSAQQFASLNEYQAVLAKSGEMTVFQGGNGLFTASNITALTSNPDGFWYSRVDGTIFFLPLQTFQPILQIALQTRITTLIWANERLYIGTHDGQVIAWQSEKIVGQVGNLGRVQDIVPMDDGNIAVAADDGWILSADLTSSQHIPVPDKTLAIAPFENKLAVANGLCGIRFFEYPSLRELGRIDTAYAQDVVSWNKEVWAMVGGSARPLDLEDFSSVTAPYAPQWKDGVMQWQPAPNGCDAVTYEIFLNGKSIATTNHPIYTAPLTHDTHWQIALTTRTGERLTSPLWTAYADYAGWAGKSQASEERLKNQAAAVSRLWFLLGVLMIGLGAVGLFRLMQLFLGNWRTLKNW